LTALQTDVLSQISHKSGKKRGKYGYNFIHATSTVFIAPTLKKTQQSLSTFFSDISCNEMY